MPQWKNPSWRSDLSAIMLVVALLLLLLYAFSRLGL